MNNKLLNNYISKNNLINQKKKKNPRATYFPSSVPTTFYHTHTHTLEYRKPLQDSTYICVYILLFIHTHVCKYQRMHTEENRLENTHSTVY